MVDALDSAHHTPLFRACEAGHIDVVEALLEGLSQHICRRFSFRVPPVMHSYLALFKVCIRSLTLRSWRSSRRTWYRQTKPTSLVSVKQLLTNLLIFIRAALGGYDFICLKLLQAQASVNFPDNQGYCLHFWVFLIAYFSRVPLHCATYGGHLDCMEVLLQNSANVNTQDNEV